MGSSFLIDGVPIPGLTPGATVEITSRSEMYDRYKLLRATLLDGTELALGLIDDFYDESPYRDLVDRNAKLTVTLVLNSDFNGDGTVDSADLAAWSLGFSTSTQGDSDGDFDTDGTDFLTWQRQVGGRGVPYSAAPEPAARTLLTAMALALGWASQAMRRKANGGARPESKGHG